MVTASLLCCQSRKAAVVSSGVRCIRYDVGAGLLLGRRVPAASGLASSCAPRNPPAARPARKMSAGHRWPSQQPAALARHTHIYRSALSSATFPIEEHTSPLSSKRLLDTTSPGRSRTSPTSSQLNNDIIAVSGRTLCKQLCGQGRRCRAGGQPPVSGDAARTHAPAAARAAALAADAPGPRRSAARRRSSEQRSRSCQRWTGAGTTCRCGWSAAVGCRSGCGRRLITVCGRLVTRRRRQQQRRSPCAATPSARSIHTQQLLYTPEPSPTTHQTKSKPTKVLFIDADDVLRGRLAAALFERISEWNGYGRVLLPWTCGVDADQGGSCGGLATQAALMSKARALGLRPKAFTRPTERFEAGDLDRWVRCGG